MPKEKELHFNIVGSPQSKANSRRAVFHNGRMMFIKSSKALEYEQTCILQLNRQNKLKEPLKGYLGIEITVYYQTKRNDLDPSIILDCLQKSGVIENDRQFIEMHFYKTWDKLQPRSDIYIYSLEV